MLELRTNVERPDAMYCILRATSHNGSMARLMLEELTKASGPQLLSVHVPVAKARAQQLRSTPRAQSWQILYHYSDTQ